MEDLIQLEDGTWIVLDESDYRNNRRRVRSRRTGGLAGRLSGRARTVLSDRSGAPVLRAQPVEPVQVIQPAPAPAPMAQNNNMISFAGRSWPVGEVVDLVASVLASTAKLPASPEPTGEPTTDLANQTKYTQALAEHAKRNEQVRTVGKLAVALFG